MSLHLLHSTGPVLPHLRGRRCQETDVRLTLFSLLTDRWKMIYFQMSFQHLHGSTHRNIENGYTVAQSLHLFLRNFNRVLMLTLDRIRLFRLLHPEVPGLV